ncbi:MAG: M20 family metallopeptidase [Phycisphaera sp.]|nr:MAG: M20 family metallopeptidase [Phycisphaera sp.]
MTTTSMPASQTISQLIKADLPRLTGLRREFHKNPELSNNEHATAKRIEAELRELGLELKTGLATNGTGIIAYLPATNPTRTTIALRGDIDALPITESTGKPYASTKPGVMHACGHDGHTAILLGAARALSQVEERSNNVLFLFQPAEEDGGGAEVMCDQGVLKGAEGGGLGEPVTRIFGLHGWPRMPLGKVGTRPGPMMASTDDFDVRIVGRGGHAAMPHLAKDPIVAASAVVMALQTIASRAVNPNDAGVITVGQFEAGTANNIIPDSARIVGTVRALTDDTRALLADRFRQVVESTAAAHGCTAEVDWLPGYPVTTNDSQCADHMLAVARQTLGDDAVEIVPEASMGGEDFSYYSRHVPACFFLLGLLPRGADPDTVPLLHQPGFDFNDDALPVGVRLMCALATA